VSWGTLYELAQLPAQLLKQHIDDGVVHPKMERKDAQALLPGKTAAPRKPKQRDTELRRVLEAKDAHIAELEAARDVTPATEQNPIVAAWDKAGRRKRHDFVLARKREIMFAQHLIGKYAFTDRGDLTDEITEKSKSVQ
jgi:hypothetical protein